MIHGPLNRYAQKQQRETDNPHERTVWHIIDFWTEHEGTLQPFLDCQKALNRAMTRIGHLIEQIQDGEPVSTGDMHYLSGLIQDAQKASREALQVITDEDD